MIEDKFNQYIREVELLKSKIPSTRQYPFDLPSVERLETLKFHPNVTFMIGENGSGKSTLLEAISVSCGFNPEGGSKNFNFATKATHSNLYQYLKLIKGVKKPRDGFFLRAESFYNVASNIEELGSDLLNSYGGQSLHAQSHGESFMSLVLNRFRGKGLYILDEPEAALSPTRQLALLSRIHQLVEDDSQFVIATHSPIIMAYPNAKIYDVDNGYDEIEYTETDHYCITKEFLNNPSKMMDIILKE
ncbi:AAA family ATPase [Marinisporobacter balticus]|uniref:Putative ATPase n=1 Tax=Marinisporobacter balticus TaxID=2018667 RepID=A0A4R2L1G8_9FIRM|nr:AAA family ATPase [Marinisporobacter balticus]TCO79442.1 putative ATPase [Marinisporobacter balticus]